VQRRRRAPAVSAAAGSPNFSPEDARKQLNRLASDARQKLEEFARQQRLKERLDGAAKVASQAAKQAADEAGKTAKKVDAEFDVSGKASEAARAAAEAARKVNEAAEDADSKFQFRRKGRILWSDLKRSAPVWGRRIRDFFETPLGAVTFLFLFLISVFTGAFWVILRVLFGLMWLGILCGPLIINYMQVKAAQEQQEQYRQYMAEQRRRQQNPFYGTPFEDLFDRGPKDPTQRPGRFGGGRSTPVTSTDDVIDVSFERLED
jgi:hypothetical protein